MMLRALGCVAVLGLSLMMGTGAARAQNLDEGKSAAQLFSANCVVCHKAAKGLAKGQAGSGLNGFLRKHYTTGTEMAGLLADYLNANGGAAGNKRLGGEGADKPGDKSADKPGDKPAEKRKRQASETAPKPAATTRDGKPAASSSAAAGEDRPAAAIADDKADDGKAIDEKAADDKASDDKPAGEARQAEEEAGRGHQAF